MNPVRTFHYVYVLQSLGNGNRYTGCTLGITDSVVVGRTSLIRVMRHGDDGSARQPRASRSVMSQCSVAATQSGGGRARYRSENLMRSWFTVGIRRATPSPVRWDGMSSFQLLTCRAIPCASMARSAMVLHRPHASCGSSGRWLRATRSPHRARLADATCGRVPGRRRWAEHPRRRVHAGQQGDDARRPGRFHAAAEADHHERGGLRAPEGQLATHVELGDVDKPQPCGSVGVTHYTGSCMHIDPGRQVVAHLGQRSNGATAVLGGTLGP